MKHWSEHISSQEPKNIALILAYDGEAYQGWQDNCQGHSVEKTLRQVCEQILRHPITLQAASRTDAGVHAEGQVVNFYTSRDIHIEALFEGINALIPPDMAVLKLWEATFDFHPTLHNHGKIYHYHLCNAQVQRPLRRHFEWHYAYPLDLPLMRQGALQLVGTHNFHAFCNTRKNLHYQDFVRTLKRLEIIELENRQLRFELEGTSFLFRMARNIVGTLAYIGRGRISPNTLPLLLQTGNRTEAGITAPAHGLILHKVLF